MGNPIGPLSRKLSSVEPLDAKIASVSHHVVKRRALISGANWRYKGLNFLEIDDLLDEFEMGGQRTSAGLTGAFGGSPACPVSYILGFDQRREGGGTRSKSTGCLATITCVSAPINTPNS